MTPANSERDPARFTADPPPEPAYLALLRSGELERRVETARGWLACCRACPRECGADRASGVAGACRVARLALVDAAFPHHGEEAVLSGRRGSGTIFFGGCNLRCVFCQNWEISQAAGGAELDAEELANAMLRLQLLGCHNINWVTPEHVVPQALEALLLAARAGLRLPVVYNTSAYDALDSLRLLDGVVDVYMPDFKLWRPATAERLLGAIDYPARARAAIVEMRRQVGDLVLDGEGIARRGLLVRHLVMPGLGEETAAILAWLGAEVSRDTWVNVMGQYRPAHRVGEPAPAGAPESSRYADIARRPSPAELAAAFAAARRAGLWRFDATP